MNLRTSLNEAHQARKTAQDGLRAERHATKMCNPELEEHRASLTGISKASRSEESELEKEPGSSTLLTQDRMESVSAASKKKKKKKKRTGNGISPSGPVTLLHDPEGKPENRSDKLFEEYLEGLRKSLSIDSISELSNFRLAYGRALMDEGITRGVPVSDLGGLKCIIEMFLNEVEVARNVEALEAKLSRFHNKVTGLIGHLDEARENQKILTAQLQTLEAELLAAKRQKRQLEEQNRALESGHEDIEDLRDMLRNVGSELVETKDRLKDVEQKPVTAESEKERLETSISRLTTELGEHQEASRLLQDIQPRVTLLESLAESRLAELNAAREKLNATEMEQVKLRTELGTVSADRNDLMAKLVDAQTKLRQTERTEKDVSESILAIRASLSTKEKEVTNLHSEVDNLRRVKADLEDSVRSAKQALSKLELDRNEIQQRERISRDESARFKREVDLFREKIASLESQRSSLSHECDALTDELQMKTTQLESANTFMQGLREQATEMAHREREAKERCEALEEELSGVHKLLSERAREAGTMRRLLDEAEGREAGRIREVIEKLENVMEERDQLEEELTLLKKNNTERGGGLEKVLQENELMVRDLASKYENSIKEVTGLMEKNTLVEAQLQDARKAADQALSRLHRLSKSLVHLIRI